MDFIPDPGRSVKSVVPAAVSEIIFSVSSVVSCKKSAVGLGSAHASAISTGDSSASRGNSRAKLTKSNQRHLRDKPEILPIRVYPNPSQWYQLF
jgi:hypothetical protein